MALSEAGAGTDRVPKWLTVEEFARIMRISRGAAYRAVATGSVGPVRRIGRVVRVHRSAVESGPRE